MGGVEISYGISFLFGPGSRPDAGAIRKLIDEVGGFDIAGCPAGSADGIAQVALAGNGTSPDGWVELICSGLSFDLRGLSPWAGRPLPDCAYPFDLSADLEPTSLEAVELRPGPHLAGGERMTPIVRVMMDLATRLCALDGLAAVAWHPARSWIGPLYFASIVTNWLDGGVFPGLGLVGLGMVADGGMQSEGVAFFTGQEIRIEPELAEDRVSAAKIAVRLIDHLVEAGPLAERAEFMGPDGRMLRIEPSSNARCVRVWGAV